MRRGGGIRLANSNLSREKIAELEAALAQLPPDGLYPTNESIERGIPGEFQGIVDGMLADRKSLADSKLLNSNITTPYGWI